MKYKKGDKVMFEKDCRDDLYKRHYHPKYHEVGEIVDVCGDEYQVVFDDNDKNKWTYLTDNEVIQFNDGGLFVSNKKGDSITLNSNGFTFTGFTGTTITGYKPEKQEMEEKEMKNEVLELWYRRKQEQIEKDYRDLAEKLEKENELINAYKTLIDDFEKSMKDLYEQDDNQEQKIIKELYCDYSYKYGLNRDLVYDMFYEKYRDEREERSNNLYKTYKEVNAQLSLSDDLDYQIETLINYGILDKKTKKMVD